MPWHVTSGQHAEKSGIHLVEIRMDTKNRGYILIFRPWRIDPRTGRKIYPRRGKVFPMKVRRRT